MPLCQRIGRARMRLLALLANLAAGKHPRQYPPSALNAIARTLRPLCRLLGVDLPAALRPPAPKPRPPRQKPPEPPPPTAGTPDRPLPRHIRLAVRAWKRKDE